MLPPSKSKKNAVGLMWDFPSLFQHPRTDEQTALFKQALGNLAAFYSHQFTMVFRLTKFPAGYPKGYKLPPGANVAEYPDRGWCFTETAWSCMVKPRSKVLNLARFSGEQYGRSLWDVLLECSEQKARPPPLTPSVFSEALTLRIFTNGKADHEHRSPSSSDRGREHQCHG